MNYNERLHRLSEGLEKYILCRTLKYKENSQDVLAEIGRIFIDQFGYGTYPGSNFDSVINAQISEFVNDIADVDFSKKVNKKDLLNLSKDVEDLDNQLLAFNSCAKMLFEEDRFPADLDMRIDVIAQAIRKITFNLGKFYRALDETEKKPEKAVK